MSAFASSSRSVLTLGSRLPKVQQVPVRSFASTSRVQTDISLRIANITASFRLPSLPSWLLPESTNEAMPALAGLPSSADLATETTEDVLNWDGTLLAVPKSKVSHSRKRMRSANKGLKDRDNLVHCAGCGSPKLAHHICASCYGVISRAQKAANRDVRFTSSKAA